jgi:gas vesicle protein
MKFLFGIFTGIVVGLMLAPSSGSETRSRIADSANDFVDTSREKVRHASESAQKKAHEVSSLINEKAQQASDYARQKADDISRSAQTAADAITEKIQRKTA